MKTHYRFIEFKQVKNVETTDGLFDGRQLWTCFSRRGDTLGWVEWNADWNKYAYGPNSCAKYSDDCLTDIAHFLQQLNKEKTRMSDGNVSDM